MGTSRVPKEALRASPCGGPDLVGPPPLSKESIMWSKIKTYVRHGIAALTGGVGGLITSVGGTPTVSPEGAEAMSQEPTTAIATAVALFTYAMVEKLLKRWSIFEEA